RIDAAIDSPNESWLNKVGEFFSGLGDAFNAIGTWIDDFLEDVVNFLHKLAGTITALIELVLVLLLVITVGALFGEVGFSVALGAAVVVAAFIVVSIASDVIKPTPAVNVLAPYEDAASKRPEPPTLNTVFDSTVEVDNLGAKEESVVKVTKVLGPDGWYYT